MLTEEKGLQCADIFQFYGRIRVNLRIESLVSTYVTCTILFLPYKQVASIQTHLQFFLSLSGLLRLTNTKG